VEASAAPAPKNRTPGSAGGSLSAPDGGEEEWSHELIEAAMLGASETLLAILRALAGRPERWLTVDEIAQGMPKLGGPTLSRTRSIGGTLGAFKDRSSE
jgi:hypothetical protein